MAVNGIEIKVGQVWKDGTGMRITITAHNPGNVYRWVSGSEYTYTDRGVYNLKNTPSRDDLVELLQEAPSVTGDSHEALIFHPLPVEGAVADAATFGTTGEQLTDTRIDPASLTDERLANATIEPVSFADHFDQVFNHATGYIDPRKLPGDPPVDPDRTNPKDLIGDKKLALHLLSPIAEAHWTIGQYAGMLKYGAWNWRVAGVRASIYISAARRHLAAYLSGEEFDPVDGSHHLGNVMACAAILLEAREIGKLTDDRPPSFSLRPTYAWAEDRMAQLKVTYADKAPRHYTIADTHMLAPVVDRKRPDDTEGGEA